MKKKNSAKTIVSLLVLLAVVLLAVWFLVKPEEVVLQGRVEATQTYLSPKIPGRIKEYKVKEGEEVQEGQLLAVLESPELDAKLSQAEAAQAGAEAQQAKAQKGARSEEINAARSIWQKAKAAADLADKTFQRVSNLYKDGVVSEQQRDEMQAKREAARRDEQAAYNNYQIALQGARSEDKDAATAAVARAQGAVSEVEVYAQERMIKSPINGEVQDLLPELGELVSAGFPVVNIIDLKDAWVVLNVKEDLLFHFEKESTFTANVPALNNKQIQFKVYYVAPLGDFATWNATKATGSFDVRTFEIRAKPVQQDTGIRPGMSVLVQSDQFKK